MKLGFVGVGRHAQKMAAAFRECGAEVVAFDRKNAESARRTEQAGQTLGYPGRLPLATGNWENVLFSPWREQISSPSIDALIVCAPPEVTTEVALACAKAGKPCVATKPLMWTDYPWKLIRPGETRSLIFVDLWRLYSPAWLAMKAELRGKTIQSVHVDFYGNGPVRSFSGLLDYGVWPVAMLADLLGMLPKLQWSGGNGKWLADELDGPIDVRIATGNGWDDARMDLRVGANDGSYSSWIEVTKADQGVPVGSHVYRVDSAKSGAPLMAHDRSLALRGFCREFLAGSPSDTLRLSCEATRSLLDAEKQVRFRAGPLVADR